MSLSGVSWVRAPSEAPFLPSFSSLINIILYIISPTQTEAVLVEMVLKSLNAPIPTMLSIPALVYMAVWRYGYSIMK